MDVESSTKPGISLAAKISSALRRDLSEGVFRPGDRLPSESALTREYSVSRTVVREAIAILRADGLVEARKGAGVFAIEVKPAKEVPFNDLAVGRISSVIELLELRTVFEVESAGLAASRRSAVQVESIVDAHRRVGDCLAAGLPTRDADFEFHLAIAQATQNRRFPEFLQLIRSGIIPRGELQGAAPGSRPKDYNLHLQEEHAKIVDAIIEGDADAARQYMAAHLRGSLERYKVLLRSRTAAE
ncbi:MULTISPECIES: FadR/GntR family transcriptional regulator [Rhizobium/Agrobacterium group]|jgi:DNA-binding FadR family transcriptional regulator|uniref:FadR family transcriptional regulator n=2 Tax=Rhizobium/Agrobacterium group TaxID=227290 RepID=A0A1B9TKS4_AGRTU|nr:MULTISPECIES: FadR/GntR family transcriptional regulator [Rhizobium/Agrobacterium group]AHK03320.1 GntR family transcriptional regulator [Agrobacterium tumefaciens LBA4213 (Ach5)]AKC09093.1 GntR family transcriptional regulator [Agrobacterium tumefaciens]EHK00093.1 GntR family transcriptional regulator [Agrobacterium tumefaciens 5A]MDP9561511.1 DNA-binding FadR family transcriptional regulator [Rhizobium nepotum]ADY66637.1 transcriptional regulator, GntR family [Agrobacterium tumefaciens]